MTTAQMFLTSTAVSAKSASQAAELLLDDGAIGYLYAPSKAEFVVRRNGDWLRITDGAERAADFSRVYELCLFTADTEVRWIQERGGIGTAFIRTESSSGSGLFAFGDPVGHLLWGEVNDARGLPANWVSTESARVGHVPVPFTGSPPAGSHLRLLEQEYAAADDNGNLYIADVRYLGIEVVSAQPNSAHKSTTGAAHHG